MNQHDIYLNRLNELRTISDDPKIHILDRIDALLEMAEIAHREPHTWLPAIRFARQLIREDMVE